MNLLAMHTLFGPTANGRQSIVKRNGGFYFARYTLCSKDFPDHYPDIAVGCRV